MLKSAVCKDKKIGVRPFDKLRTGSSATGNYEGRILDLILTFELSTPIRHSSLGTHHSSL